MKKICQVNNIKIYEFHVPNLGVYYRCVSPTGIWLEEFKKLEGAKAFAKNTKDFIRKQGV
jgi:hypothetical protein